MTTHRPLYRKVSSLLIFVFSIHIVFAHPAYALNYYQKDKSRSVMPVSNNNLRPAKIDWTQGKQANAGLLWIRQIQNLFKAYFTQEAVNRVLSSKSGFVVGKNSTDTTQILQDRALASVVRRGLAGDNLLTRNDMLSVFKQVGADNLVSSAEFYDLQTIIANPTFFPELDYVRDLADNLVNGNAWNQSYRGESLGNLTVNSSGVKLQKLVNKWFLGMDTPTAVDAYGRSYTYAVSSGSLFSGGVGYADIRQGYIGDCWLLASFAEAAVRDSKLISEMFIDNGDGTYTVRFFEKGVAHYVTVNRELPVDSKGRFGFDGVGSYASAKTNELWAPLAEKAYVQFKASLGSKNSYSAISGGYIGVGLNHITGYSAWIGNALNFTNAVAKWTAGALMGFASKSTGVAKGIVAGHAYTVTAYDAATQSFTLFNPWGMKNGFAADLLTLTWSAIQASFSYFDYALK